MKLRNYKNTSQGRPATTITFLILLLINFSCQENGADEMQIQTSSFETRTSSELTTNAALENADRLNEFVGEPISNETAERWIKSYLAQNPNGTRSRFIGLKSLQRLINQPGFIGLNIEYGKNDENEDVLLFIGVNKEKRRLNKEGEQGYTDKTFACPSDCVLN